MPRNGSGSYSLPSNSWNPPVNGASATPADFAALSDDIADALTASVAADGQTPMTGNLNMGNNRVTSVASATALTDALTAAQAQNGSFVYLTGTAGTNTITASLTGLAAYAAGQEFRFIAAGDNTGATTININSLGAKSITKNGTSALASGDIKSGRTVSIIYDGTQFQLVSEVAGGPCFAAYAAVVQSISSATPTKVTLGTEVFDVGSCFASSRFTPTQEGYYQFNGVVLGNATNMTGLYVAFYKNGTLYSIGENIAFAAQTGSIQVTHSDLISLNGSTDYVELYAYVVGTSPSVSTTSSGQTCRFSGFLARRA